MIEIWREIPKKFGGVWTPRTLAFRVNIRHTSLHGNASAIMHIAHRHLQAGQMSKHTAITCICCQE